MAEMWYYTNEGKQMDPVPMKELMRLVGDGVLKPTDMVWKEGMARWIRASSVKELFPDPAASLDHYFSQPGKASMPGPFITPSAAPLTPTPTSAPSGPRKADDDRPEPQSQSKRPRKSEDENDDRPMRNRQGSGGGSMVGILIALFLGGGVLLVALVVGIIIIIVVNQPGPQPQQANIFFPGQGNPRPEPMAPFDPKNEVKGGVPIVFELKLNSNEKRFRDFSFRQGGKYEIVVKTRERPAPGVIGAPDVDLRVFGIDNNPNDFLVGDIGPEADCKVVFLPPKDGQYRVEIHNCLNQGAQPMVTNSTITVRELEAPPPAKEKDDPTKDPLPPGVLAGNGLSSLSLIQPGQSKEIKLRVKGGYKASVKLTMAPLPTKFKLVILKENDDTEIAKADREINNPDVVFTLPATEIVRVRVTNTSGGIKGASKQCGLQYDVGK